MIRYCRPTPPPGFPSASLIAAEAEMEAAVLDGTPVTFRDHHWREWTRVFAAAQHQKCAFCECSLQGAPPNLEHFAPKGEVALLLECGAEDADNQRVVGRKEQPLHPVGYWWLAYAWSNWLVACSRCNSAWKKNFFPVQEEPHPPPSSTVPYTPLLLHPYDDPDPEEHLMFDQVGQVAPRDGSQRGRATIDTCGLDRPSLQLQRKRALDEASCTLNAMLIAGVDLEALDSLKRDDRLYAAAVRDLLRRFLEA